MKVLLSKIVPPFLVIVLIIAAWDVAVRVFGIPPFLVPSPKGVLDVIIERSDTLFSGCLATAITATVGLVVAGVVGVVAGVVISSSRLLLAGVYPIASFLQTVPLVAVAPLLVIWLGYGAPPAIAAAALVALFPVLANTIDGLRSVDPQFHEVFNLYHSRRFDRWWKLEIPGAVPGIITGLRIATGLSVIGSIVGEFVSGYAGDNAPIGMIVMSAMRESRTDMVFAAVALSSLVGLALFGIVSLGGSLLLRAWHPSAKR